MLARHLFCVILTLGALICLQGFALAQSSGSSSGNGNSPDLGTLSAQNDGIAQKGNQSGTAAFKIQNGSGTSGSMATGGLASNTVTSAIIPYLVQLLAFFRVMAMLWLLILTVVMGIGYAMQHYKFEDLIHGILGAFIVIAAQVLAGLFAAGLPTTGS